MRPVCLLMIFLLFTLLYLIIQLKINLLILLKEPFREKALLKPLSHWTATVLRQLATDIASGSQSSLETVTIDS